MKKFFSLFLILLSSPLLIAQGFTEVSEEAGINHAFRLAVSTFGGGVVVFDYNNDGYEDLYLPGGNDLDHFYHNNGDGTFTNIFDEEMFARTIPVNTQGAAAADIDRDGDKDLIVTTLYDIETQELKPNLLYLNNGNGTFTDVTTQYGLENFVSSTQGASFGDINADGYPDLYIANYINASPKGIPFFTGRAITDGKATAKDWLYINTGGEYFQEVSELYGIDHDGFGFQALFTDWDNDRDLDILIANDFGYEARPNIALLNEFPEKKFSYVELPMRFNYGMNAMGFGVGDFNFDGWMDYYVTNINTSLCAENIDGMRFADVGEELMIAIGRIEKPDFTGIAVSWGANFFDYDHDTDLDLFVAHGSLNPNVRPIPSLFFECLGPRRYFERGTSLKLDDMRIGRGSVTFDYDNDGDLDLLVVNQHAVSNLNDDNLLPARTLLYRNDLIEGNWLKVKLEGVHAEKDGLGSRVEIVVNDRLMIREIDGGSSHISQNSTIAHFGLDDIETVESVVVKWIGGKTQEVKNVSANQQITIRETDEPIFNFDKNALKVYPSLFTENDDVIIEYELERKEPFDISIYDVKGRLIETLNRQNNPAQTGFWVWNVRSDLSPGVYIFQLRTKNIVVAEQAIKM